MERAGRLLGNLGQKKHGLSDEELARSAWRVAVGRKIDEHTGGLRLIRTRLVIEVEDAVWQRQLFSLRHQILANLRKELGADLVTELEFRVGLPRRLPVRAQSAQPAGDEADAIRDPGMRRIYMASRRKGTG